METPLFTIELQSQRDVVLCRGRARDLAAALGFEGHQQTQIATAVSEIARNAVQHGGGGGAEFFYETGLPNEKAGARQSLLIRVRDSGPGIAHLQEILGGNPVSSAGASGGLIGAKRILDAVEFQTSPKGTLVTLRQALPSRIAPLERADLQRIASRIVTAQSQNEASEVRQQNQELIRTLQELNVQQTQLTTLNDELVDTNRGVVALYHELDTLHHIGTLIASRLDLQPLLADIVSAAMELVGADFGIAFHRESESDPLQMIATRGLQSHVVELLPTVTVEMIFGDAVSVREISCIADGPMEQFCQQLELGRPLLRYLAVPVFNATGVLVTVLVFGREEDAAFGEATLRLMLAVATQVSVGVQNAMLYRELHKANAAKDRFLAVLSHELRTPLTPVYVIAQSFEQDAQLPPALREQASILRRNVELEVRLIDDLLDTTRISRGKLQLAIEPVKIDTILQNVAAICESEAANKQVHLVLDLAANDCQVAADPARLQQVFWNLMKNAIKFTPADGQVTLSSRLLADGTAAVEVTDTGMGIHSDTLPKVFDAFEQGGSKTGARFGGLGLGLSITKALVRAHRGEISAFSLGLNQGATFIVTLPVAAHGSEPSKAAEVAPAMPEISSARGAKILLVDDHADTLLTMTRLLERRGYEITPASTMTAAIEAGATHSFDLLISDIGLPDGSGLKLPAALAEFQPVPGIAMSGFGTENDLARSEAAGFAKHLTKPINVEQLILQIERLVSRPAPVRNGAAASGPGAE